MTIKDLSAQTGYSVGTVSRVLNNHPNVSPQARQAVLAAAARSGFQLNANAKHLRQQHATTILAVVKGTSNELFGALVEQIQRLVESTKYPLLVDYVDEDANEVLRALQLCRERKPVGILFLGGNRRHFKADFAGVGLPCVVVTNDASGLGFPNLSSVTTDDYQAAAKAIDGLVALGHRHIGLIGGDRAVSDTARLRFSGCMEAFARHKIPFDPERSYRGVRFSFAGGYRAARELLALNPEMTAIFAASDVMAIGAIRALRDCSLQVPEDITVLGFDGLPIGEYYVPKLSTVAQSVEDLAQKSVEILLEGVEQDGGARYLTVPFAVHWKESARVLPAGSETG